MDAVETTLGILMAVGLTAVAGYFAWHQRNVMQSVRAQVNLPSEQRRYYLKQTGRRLFGSFLLVVLAGLLVGSLFLDWDPSSYSTENKPAEEMEAAKQAFRFITFYWMTIPLILMVILALAVVDLWATARFGVQQQKQLAREHQNQLEAELSRLKQRRAELN